MTLDHALAFIGGVIGGTLVAVLIAWAEFNGKNLIPRLNKGRA